MSLSGFHKFTMGHKNKGLKPSGHRKTDVFCCSYRHGLFMLHQPQQIAFATPSTPQTSSVTPHLQPLPSLFFSGVKAAASISQSGGVRKPAQPSPLSHSVRLATSYGPAFCLNYLYTLFFISSLWSPVLVSIQQNSTTTLYKLTFCLIRVCLLVIAFVIFLNNDKLEATGRLAAPYRRRGYVSIATLEAVGNVCFREVEKVRKRRVDLPLQ